MNPPLKKWSLSDNSLRRYGDATGFELIDRGGTALAELVADANRQEETDPRPLVPDCPQVRNCCYLGARRLHRVSVGTDEWIDVVGVSEQAEERGCEWVHRGSDGVIVAHSDNGFASVASALHAGLSRYNDLPESGDVRAMVQVLRLVGSHTGQPANTTEAYHMASGLLAKFDRQKLPL